MPGPILATKLYIPPPPANVVLRPRLLERINGGLQRKLLLIAAPAGCGKTTLLSAWVANSPYPVAWLSLDPADSDPERFLSYLVAALHGVAPDIGGGALGLLQSPQPPPAEVILTTLLNEVSTIDQHLVLILDDYHVIESQAVDDALTFLVEHLPPRLHLVIATREDPPLPLARLRARGQLVELRAGDLRFSPTETAGFLRAMNLDLSTAQVAALDSRTEGWIAGLQLAALSLQGHPDVAGFIQAFAGDNRYIADYLIDEVLALQSEELRRFLLQTSILESLHGPLCDAVTGQQSGQARLIALERGNFFVVPLDDRRQWYRYHHLFAEVLAAHLRAEQADQVAPLHRRASEWYERNNSTAAAIRHALAAADFARAANLVERAMPAMRRGRQELTLLGWLRALPEEVVRVRPVLSAGYAAALLSSGILEGVERRLRDAEHWLDQSMTAEAMVVVDEEEERRLPGALAVARAAVAMMQGDVAASVQHAHQVLDLVAEDDHVSHGSAAAILGLAAWRGGDLESAYTSYIRSMARLQRTGNISDAVGGVVVPADIRIAQGRLGAALHIYEQALELARTHGDRQMRGTADMYVGMSEIERERNDLDAALEHLRKSKEQGEHTGFPQYPYRWRVVMARLLQAQGDLSAALALLDEAARLYVSDFLPNVRPVEALRARLWALQGRFDEALGWARVQGLSTHDQLSYLREFEHITLARVLLERYKSDRAEQSLGEATGLLERLLPAARAGERMGSAIEILVLLTVARRAQGNIPAALDALRQALALGEPEGYVRIFVDEGPDMAALLREAEKRGIAPGYVRRLLAASGKAEYSPPLKQALIEPLSARELEVLQLLKTELSGPEIAAELMVSLPTVRTHTNSIYLKLGVNNRRAAIRRAEELNLI